MLGPIMTSLLPKGLTAPSQTQSPLKTPTAAPRGWPILAEGKEGKVGERWSTKQMSLKSNHSSALYIFVYDMFSLEFHACWLCL